MNFSKASQGLNLVKSYLSNITQVDNTSIIKSNKTISWNNRKTGIHKNNYYPLEYQYILDLQQYSFLLSDSSFFQFYYNFDSNGALYHARLAYYPRPINSKDSYEELFDEAENALERENNNLSEHLYNLTELIEIKKQYPSNTSHIRFDFDQKVKSHSESHIQFSGIQELRIPANFFPLPLSFVQLCESIFLDKNTGLNESDLKFDRNNILKSLNNTDQIISLRFS